ncbi:MAG: copper amine oxidase N-terminal domain-containing protein [Candidatus Onthomonas sp.]|nr:copper amine oxidase N-terminal domain-containing protein [Candidatus Onthomonas sp.]
MRKRSISLLLVLCLCIPWGAVTAAAAEPEGKAVFTADSADAEGCFDLTLTLYNARFNVFSFALRYDPDTVEPVDAAGKTAAEFWDFADKGNTPWMSTIGESLDADKGLIEFTGYVNPGKSVTTDGREKVTGVANVGASGLEVFTFRFKKLGTAPVVIELAAQSATKPWAEDLPAGGAILDAGESMKASYEVQLPADLGTSGSVSDEGTAGGGTSSGGTSSGDTAEDKPAKPVKPAVTADELVENTLFLQIGNRAAVAFGGVTAIYPGEPDVYAYINGDGRTMIPVRFVAERLGATVVWDHGVVDIRKGDTVIRMPVGSKEYTINGVTKTMDTATIRPAHGRTMVPIRFVAEALGYHVQYDTTYHMAIISAKDWTPGGKTEEAALSQASGLLIMYGGFVM